MKKLSLTFILAFAALAGCKNEVKKVDYSMFSGDYSVVTIDSCEYIYIGWGNTQSITHKGNCKNHKP